MSNKLDDCKQLTMPRRDFIYLCIILVIILISVCSFFFGGSTRAGESLNFGATLVSIILAVLAIVITLIDIGGQKNNVLDLKESVEKINKALSQSQLLIESTKEQVFEINSLKEQLLGRIEESIKFQEEIKEMIRGSEGEEIDKEAILKALEEREKQKQENVFIEASNMYQNNNAITEMIESVIKESYAIGQEFTFKDLREKLDEKYIKLSSSVLVFTMKKLEKMGVLSRITSANSGAVRFQRNPSLFD
ncbi:hypothetical protein DFP93_102132 [Aneurinibacillus soli]|uniref:Uncharacterized protein n=1 Tax=Aneurinibacillus soli TaxID=1500254 RepID=A0A0U4NFV1_9BACL|nr:hypothetical protein [Aneurinibacillus soli]PYE63448.1 hypothetical protein DFP93_102132 [Aneurinibacillus soli]BAU27620.1 hypothetical protein CB4_01794 [Aneurinibacillus soli]